VALRSSRAPSDPGVSERGLDSAIVAEGVGKLYPETRVTVFPPVVSIFDRWSGRREAPGKDAKSADADAGRSGPPPKAAAPERRRGDDLDDDDDDEGEDDDEETTRARPGGPTPWRPGEMFWAIRDVSFRVPAGKALGVLGGPGAGKTTLLNILGGQSFPTEGRVLVRDPVSPPPGQLRKALNFSAQGTFDFDLVIGSRLAGLDGRSMKQYREEIEELAQPIETPDGEMARGASDRLAVASNVVLPSSVILIEELPGMDDEFTARVIERARERLRGGTSLVFASRRPELVQELCDEVIVLSGGRISDSGATKGALRRYEEPSGPRPASGEEPGQRPVEVPEVVAGFNERAALLSATCHPGTGIPAKQLEVTDELWVEIRLETAVPDVEAQCGVSFVARGGRAGVRIELPHALRFPEPGVYTLVAQVAPGAVPAARYQVRADAVVSGPEEQAGTVIARDAGRFRITGDALDGDDAAPLVEHWDGQTLRRVEAAWTVE
jgi:ABC-type polysaccharide/polyol phosphate transport system ATPase subunit